MFARASLAVAALLALTGAGKPTAPPVLTIVATDYAFTVPGGANATLPAGPVTLRLINHGKEIHMMGVVLLGDTTAAQFIAAVNHHGFVGTEVGGVNGVAPGDTGTSTVILKPGNAVIACYIESADHKEHVLKGMFAPIRVTPNAGVVAAEPHTTYDISLRDFAITVPEGLRAGPHVFRVDNQGPATHDLMLFRMSPGADTADAMAWLEKSAVGSTRAHPLGGIVGEEHGLHSYFFANLTPGDYMLLCWMPDAKTGIPHFYGHHMWTRFHVSS
ncbi:MAG TPA: hypothetical protein VFW04_10125 [Gemmatimonadaceae bacterium]|nr:hypothetical protein [Gemmatimonadaceae bacterium]